MDRNGPSWVFEAAIPGLVAGVDEAGRGPLAGPVVAAAVIFERGRAPEGLGDSKRLSRAARERLFDLVHEQAAAVAIAQASVEEIDRLNILQASLLAMRRAIASLAPAPAACLVDGNCDPRCGRPTRCIVRGDGQSVSIAAASILAKVARDRIMADLARRHPQYGWETNAGYGVPAHLDALRLVGATPHHRRSFAPVREILLQGNLPIH